MKLLSLDTLKLIATDRHVVTLLGAFVLSVLIFCISIAITLEPSELQVVNQYTAYGGTNFYRDQWYYYLNYIGFGLMVGVVHSLIAAKLYQEKDRQFTIMFTWLSLAVLVIGWMLAQSVLQVASLS